MTSFLLLQDLDCCLPGQSSNKLREPCLFCCTHLVDPYPLSGDQEGECSRFGMWGCSCLGDRGTDRCRVDGGRGAIAGPFPSVPLRTVHDRFRVTRLSGGCFPPVQNTHISCSSPWEAVRLDRFAFYVAFPRSLAGHHSHDSYRSSFSVA